MNTLTSFTKNIAHLSVAADPATVNTLRWFGIAATAFGIAIIFLRWWRKRR